MPIQRARKKTTGSVLLVLIGMSIDPPNREWSVAIILIDIAACQRRRQTRASSATPSRSEAHSIFETPRQEAPWLSPAGTK